MVTGGSRGNIDNHRGQRTDRSVADTLRYYEKAGLISPVRRPEQGQRRYTANDMAWIKFLLRLRETGMSITDMQYFAELRRTGDGTIPERLELLRCHREWLNVQVERLHCSGLVLDEKIAYYENHPVDTADRRDHDGAA